MKKCIYPILSAVLGAIVFGASGLVKFMGYGASDCDVDGKICDCFCCNLFGLRGYEACGDFGLLAGGIIGVALGLIIYYSWIKLSNKNTGQ